MTSAPDGRPSSSAAPVALSWIRRALALTPVLLGLAASTLSRAALEGQTSQGSSGPDAPWQYLFDGQTPHGWRAWQGRHFPKQGWVITNQCLVRWPGPRAGDLVTEAEFEDFELEWEWKIVPGGNNGVKYLVLESRPNAPGHEYQMVDDRTVSDPRHRTAAFYDVLAPDPAARPYPPGQWNRSRIVVRGTTVEHWLNGQRVLQYDLGSPVLLQAIQASKFRNAPGFGQKCRGRIMLTDHGTETWFRNLRVRVLSSS